METWPEKDGIEKTKELEGSWTVTLNNSNKSDNH